ncbi:hypothetical protein ES703_63874 [subsurface metagenome]
MKVVSDTSPIIAFSNLGKLYILKALFNRITIPRGVYDELCEGEPFQLEEWIYIEEISDRSRYNMLRSELDHGESEALVLYLEKRMELLLLDDGEARKVAESFGMKITGTGGLLLLARQQGLINSVRSEIDKLEKEGEFRLSNSVRNILLQAAGE